MTIDYLIKFLWPSDLNLENKEFNCIFLNIRNFYIIHVLNKCMYSVVLRITVI